MGKSIYPYYKWYKVTYLLIMTFSFSICIDNEFHGFKDDGDPKWTLIIVTILIYLAILFFLFFKFSLPGIRGETALILDDEKLEDRTTRKIIYWDNIKDVALSEFFSLITLKLKDDKITRIDIGRFKGSNSEIFNTILSYSKNRNQKISTNSGVGPE